MRTLMRMEEMAIFPYSATHSVANNILALLSDSYVDVHKDYIVYVSTGARHQDIPLSSLSSSFQNKC